ncbi:hypothetical protein BJ878DRAFT_120497 [Calycina marina]|uniref:DUF3500 domain-containing protein n=1 Tax=Calycina marina TaxID=1763456 RepID=A0A9P7Z0Y8_9HELO|nr:hypothetical protein BJ878DRAFT_120497 [Calycina marina]
MSGPLRAAYRDYLPGPNYPRLEHLSTSNAHQWGEKRAAEHFVAEWMKSWKELHDKPYQGITTDGNVLANVYHLAHDGEDHGAPTAVMVNAAHRILEIASVEEWRALSYPLEADEWREWMNPEIYVFKNGVRLEDVSDELVSAIHGLLKASLSPSGYKKSIDCIKVNAFLGELINGKGVLNERSYNFALFGDPSLTSPWGWYFYGHHLCLNCLVVGTQQVISPIFMGAEPNVIDAGPDTDVTIFYPQESAALALMQSLSSKVQSQAQIYDKLYSPEMPKWRFHRADQRQLGGAFQDNRIVPYEGVLVTAMSSQQQEALLEIVRLFIDYLPPRVLAARLNEVQSYWKETFFSWIGGFANGDAFYYKVHSPVIMIEFDHHTGVFLTNKEPLHFHIHTLVRTPNGNDYGKELLKQYYAREQCNAQGTIKSGAW